LRYGGRAVGGRRAGNRLLRFPYQWSRLSCATFCLHTRTRFPLRIHYPAAVCHLHPSPPVLWRWTLPSYPRSGRKDRWRLLRDGWPYRLTHDLPLQRLRHARRLFLTVFSGPGAHRPRHALCLLTSTAMCCHALCAAFLPLRSRLGCHWRFGRGRLSTATTLLPSLRLFLEGRTQQNGRAFGFAAVWAETDAILHLLPPFAALHSYRSCLHTPHCTAFLTLVLVVRCGGRGAAACGYLRAVSASGRKRRKRGEENENHFTFFCCW